MRAEVNPLIETAKQEVERLSAIEHSKQEVEREQYFDKRFEYWQALKLCLSNCTEVREINPGAAGTMFISWNENQHHDVVVEISAFAPIVAIYLYGTPPFSLLTTLDRCLNDLGLTKLTNEEIAQLEQEHWYHSIF